MSSKTIIDVDSQPEFIEFKIFKKRTTPEEHITHYTDLIGVLDQEIERKSKLGDSGIKFLRKIRKKVTGMKKEFPIVISRKGRYRGNKKTSGLVKPFPISKELAEFLEVDPSSLISRLDATRAVCVYAKLDPEEEREEMLRWKNLNPGGKRNLQNPDNKSVIIPDSKLSRLLKYDEYKKAVSEGKVVKNKVNKETGKKTKEVVETPDLKYWVIQRLITKHLRSGNKASDRSPTLVKS